MEHSHLTALFVLFILLNRTGSASKLNVLSLRTCLCRRVGLDLEMAICKDFDRRHCCAVRLAAQGKAILQGSARLELGGN